MKPASLKVRKGISSWKTEDFQLNPKGSSIYFMGICGTAMSSLAIFLKKEGFKISGSDQNVYPPVSTLLESYKIPIHLFNKQNLSQEIDLVIVGNVIGKANPEVQALEELNIPYLSLPDFLEQVFLKYKKNIVACGTHGKSTITSLMAHVGYVADLSPNYFVGGISQDLKSSFSVTSSDWFVIEGDEYDTAFFAKYPKFIHYNPFALILTDIEFDHFDIYKDIESIVSVFYELIQKVPKEGVICVHSKNKWMSEIKKRAKASVITYGLDEGDFQGSGVEFSKEGAKFNVKYEDKNYPIELGVYGYHNVLNALGVFSLAYYLDWPVDKILKGLKSFKGMKRRLQKRGEVNGASVYEDFAHHPTAVKTVLKSLKEMHPKNNVFAVFEPRSFTSRTSLFQKEYILSFEPADFVFLFPPYNISVIPDGKRFSSQKLVKDINNQEGRAFLVKNRGDLIEKLKNLSQPGDAIVLMSNGDLEDTIQLILK